MWQTRKATLSSRVELSMLSSANPFDVFSWVLQQKITNLRYKLSKNITRYLEIVNNFQQNNRKSFSSIYMLLLFHNKILLWCGHILDWQPLPRLARVCGHLHNMSHPIMHGRNKIIVLTSSMSSFPHKELKSGWLLLPQSHWWSIQDAE